MTVSELDFIDTEPRYRYKAIFRAHVAAEVELIIGLVTTAMVVYYTGNLIAALGTLVGFLILEHIVLLLIANAENTAVLRAQLDEVVDAQRDARAPERVTDHFYELEDRFHWLRVAGISIAVTVGIVVVEEFLL